MSAPSAASNRHYTPGQGLPLGSPAGFDADELSAQVMAEFAQSREPNTSAVPSAEASSGPVARRIGRRVLAQLDDHLSDRDREVVTRVAEHRFLTTHQIQAFCFTEHQSDDSAGRTTRRVLSRLQRDGLLRALERRIGGVRSGSAATIWQLTAAGQRLVRPDKRCRRGSPSERFLAHCLAIADVHVLLRQHRRIEAIENVAVEIEPASWRRYQGPSGEPRWLQPDLYAEITTSDFVDRLFIEVDLGTESLPTLLSKCEQFEKYRRSGVEQAKYRSFPLVLWLLTSAQRAHKLEQAVRRSANLTDAMYRFATPETLTQVLAGDTA